MSEEIIKSILAILPPIIATLFGGYISLRIHQLWLRLDDVHTLVNSNMGIQLKLNADNSKFRAEISKKPEDITAALEAQRLLKNHIRQQKAVDDK